MTVGIPILDIPLPIIAGLLLGSAGHFEILESTRRLLRKLDFMKKKKNTMGIRSKYKKKTITALINGLKSTITIYRLSESSKHIPRLCAPEKPLFSKV
ncbi:hypothetical protein NPIL_247701 [Nephila pilipes]|uniref:Uncharacterized protein n=1 Tax=Nephila pilipes TaxID=299642 RepID=A0A8X6MGC6_NEPPI|nr:hypothetical protein NPIL_247701 [Nephila pilipes]